jgi:tetratricopeptide (TPR) repeat protein
VLQAAIIVFCSGATAGSLAASKGPSKTAIADIPAEAVNLCDEGTNAIESGNFEMAIGKLQKAVEIAPDYALAVENLCTAHNRRGAQIDTNPLSALSEFDKALFYDPKNWKPLGNAANMMRMLGKNPKLFADRVELGDKDVANKDYLGAVVEYGAALALAPKDDSDTRNKLTSAAQLAGSRPTMDRKPEFKSYMTALQRRIKQHWQPPPIGPADKLTVIFHLDRKGLVHGLHLQYTTGIAPLDRSAIVAVTKAAPFDPLPAGSPQDAQINFSFDYNTHGQPLPATMSVLAAAEQRSFERQGEESALKNEIAQLEKSEEDQKTLIKTILQLTPLYVTDGHDAEAESWLTKALKLQETGAHTTALPKTLNSLAEIYCRQNRFAEAESSLKQSIQLCEADSQLGVFNLWQAYKLYGGLLIQTNHKEQAKEFFDKSDATIHQLRPTIADYDQAIKLDPDDAANYFLRGDIYFHRSDWDHALSDYDKAIKLNSHYAYALCHRASAYHYQKRDSDALEDLAKAIDADPDFDPPYRTRGMLYNDQKKYDLALKDFDQALKLDKNDSETLLGRGDAYSALTQYKEALSDFDQVIKITPDGPAAYGNRAIVLIHQKKFEYAILDLDKAIQLKPNYFAAFANRGLAYVDLKQYTRALQDYARALELKPDDALTHLNRGVALLFTKDYDSARREFDQTIKLKPDYGLAYANRSCVDWQQGNYQATIDDADKAISLDPTLPNAYVNRGKAHLSLKEYEAALADLSKSIEIDPAMLEGEAYYYRAKVYEATGKEDLAAADRKKVETLGYRPL